MQGASPLFGTFEGRFAGVAPCVAVLTWLQVRWVAMADKDEEIARLKARVAELEGTGACCAPESQRLCRCLTLSAWRSLSLPAAVESASSATASPLYQRPLALAPAFAFMR